MHRKPYLHRPKWLRIQVVPLKKGKIKNVRTTFKCAICGKTKSKKG
jgi:hypothetical protein